MHMEGVSHCPQGSYSVYLYTFFQAAVACLQNIESDKLKKIWRLSVQAKEKGYLLDKKKPEVAGIQMREQGEKNL